MELFTVSDPFLAWRGEGEGRTNTAKTTINAVNWGRGGGRFRLFRMLDLLLFTGLDFSLKNRAGRVPPLDPVFEQLSLSSKVKDFS